MRRRDFLKTLVAAGAAVAVKAAFPVPQIGDGFTVRAFSGAQSDLSWSQTTSDRWNDLLVMILEHEPLLLRFYRTGGVQFETPLAPKTAP